MKMGWDRVGLTCNAVWRIKTVFIGYAALRRAVECVGADFVAALGVGRARLNSCCGGGCGVEQLQLLTSGSPRVWSHRVTYCWT